MNGSLAARVEGSSCGNALKARTSGRDRDGERGLILSDRNLEHSPPYPIDSGALGLYPITARIPHYTNLQMVIAPVPAYRCFASCCDGWPVLADWLVPFFGAEGRGGEGRRQARSHR